MPYFKGSNVGYVIPRGLIFIVLYIYLVLDFKLKSAFEAYSPSKCMRSPHGSVFDEADELQWSLFHFQTVVTQIFVALTLDLLLNVIYVSSISKQ